MRVKMKGMGKNVGQVAVWTMVSRLLGLLRDVLIFATLGAGLVSSAFILAYTLPNLFRRLLGEGALTSSTIPVLAQCLQREGKTGAFGLLNTVMGRLGMLLTVLVLLAIPMIYVFERQLSWYPRWHAAAQLSQVLFPYMIFVCLGALICGALNVLGRFKVAAMNQIWLNVTMIGGAVLGMAWYPDDIWMRVYLLSAGVIIGGILQLLVPAIALAGDGWRPDLIRPAHTESQRVLRLFWPALLGAAIFQINILVVRFLAFSLDDTATSLLYISSRLVELPLGVFAIAITTVIFPELSKLKAQQDDIRFAKTYQHGLGLIFMFMLPATVGLVLLARPVLSVLFEYGLFAASDVLAATPVLQVAVLGLPFFAWSTLLTRAYYARQQMRTPVKLAGVNLVLNLIFGLLFMRIWGVVGLAFANTLSALVHCVLLQLLMPGRTALGMRPEAIVKMSAALLLMGVAAQGVIYMIHRLPLSGRWPDLILVATVVPLAVVVYFGALYTLRYGVLMELIASLRRREIGTGSPAGPD